MFCAPVGVVERKIPSLVAVPGRLRHSDGCSRISLLASHIQGNLVCLINQTERLAILRFKHPNESRVDAY